MHISAFFGLTRNTSIPEIVKATLDSLSFQTLDLIEACGDAEAFCRSNILKYASRYDKKGSARQDLLKVLHYGILLMHFHTKRATAQSDADWAAQDY